MNERGVDGASNLRSCKISHKTLLMVLVSDRTGCCLSGCHWSSRFGRNGASAALSRNGAEVRATSNISGAEAAREIYRRPRFTTSMWWRRMISWATITIPADKTLHLSSKVFHEPSVASLGIAAHETGHAIQHAKAYAPLKWRMAIVPVTSIASKMLPFVIFGGFIFHITGLITLGIYCYLFCSRSS